MKISLKRAYEDPDPKDGLRILVDRLWPRGLSREAAGVDVWLKSVSPSSELRKWYQHDVDKWPEFRKRYFKELDKNREAVDELLGHIGKGKVTFLYSAKDSMHNNAVALLDYLKKHH